MIYEVFVAISPAQSLNQSISQEEIRSIFSKWGKRETKTQEIQLNRKERVWLKEHPVIKVHNEMDWPPFNYNENSVHKGLSIDYMNLLAEKLGIEVEYISGKSWNEFLEMIKAKKLDVMLNIVRTEDRLKYILFTEPYIKNPNIIVSRIDNPYNSIEDLKKGTIALPRGFFYEEILTRDYPEIDLYLLENTLACLKAVITGDADAAFGEDAVANYLITHNMLTGLHISGQVSFGNDDYENLRIGVRDDYPLLRSILEKARKSVSQEELNNIFQKWQTISTETGKKEAVDDTSYLVKMIIRIVLIVIIFIILISFLHRILKKSSRKK